MKPTEARELVMALPDLPTRKDAARLLGVSVRTVQRLEARGLIVPMRLSCTDAGRVVYTRRAVAELLVRVSGEPL